MSAECKSFDYLMMSLCLDFHKRASCSGYLFRSFVNIENSLDGFENYVLDWQFWKIVIKF